MGVPETQLHGGCRAGHGTSLLKPISGLAGSILASREVQAVKTKKASSAAFFMNDDELGFAVLASAIMRPNEIVLSRRIRHL